MLSCAPQGAWGFALLAFINFYRFLSVFIRGSNLCFYRLLSVFICGSNICFSELRIPNSEFPLFAFIFAFCISLIANRYSLFAAFKLFSVFLCVLCVSVVNASNVCFFFAFICFYRLLSAFICGSNLCFSELRIPNSRFSLLSLLCFSQSPKPKAQSPHFKNLINSIISTYLRKK